MKYVVYAIIDPRNYEIFYIGETGNFSHRREQHIEGTNQISGLVIKQIKEAGFLPHFVILEHCPSEEDALHAEVAWQRHFKSITKNLSNSQAFNGHADRQKERRKQTKALESMISSKREGQTLRRIANGKTYKTTKNDRASNNRNWSELDIARLKGMNKKKMKVAVMAKLLERNESTVRSKLNSIREQAV